MTDAERNRILEEHLPTVRSAVSGLGLRRDEVADAMQDAHVEVLHRLPQWSDATCPLRVFIYGAARAGALDARRRGDYTRGMRVGRISRDRHGLPVCDQPNANTPARPERTQAEVVDDRDEAEVALARMTPTQSKAMRLWCQLGSQAKAAAMLGCGTSNITRLKRRAALRQVGA